MKTGFTTALSLALLCMAVPCGGQSTDEESSYTGKLTGVNVYVRSGPGSAAYPCTQLSAPAKVRVVGARGDWLKIEAPQDVFCVISKNYVKPNSSGKTGTVTGDNIWVRAGGPLAERNRSKLEQYGMLQGRLSTGAKVRIIGRGDDYYKITPPKGAYFWISADYVQRVNDGGATATRPATGETTDAADTRATDTAPWQDDTQDVRDKERQKFMAIEKLMKQKFQKPKDQRDLKEILNKYQELEISDDSYLKPWVQARIKYLKTAIEQMEDLREIEDLLQDAAEKQRQYRQKRQEVRQDILLETATHPAALGQRAKGVLSRSAMFPGGATGPRLFMLQDPDTGQVDAYVQCTTGAVDLTSYLGKYVSVSGKGRYEAGLSTYVIEAGHVVVLQEDVELPAPPRPRVAPPEIPSPPAEPEPEPVEPKPMPAEPEPESVEPEPEPVEPEPVEPEAPTIKIEPELPSEPEPEPEPEPRERPDMGADEGTVPPSEPETPGDDDEPLPPTGLPLVSPSTQPDQPIDPDEYK